MTQRPNDDEVDVNVIEEDEDSDANETNEETEVSDEVGK